MKYKVLIIDDGYSGRDEVYSCFFEKNYEEQSGSPCFKTYFLDNPKSMEENIRKINADAILIDAVLDAELGWEGVKFEMVLDKIKAAYNNSIPPIFLISAKWDVELIGTVNNAFAESLPNVLPKKYYTYSSISNKVAEANLRDVTKKKSNCDGLIKERNKIHKIIAKHYGRTDKKLYKKDEINILHISDLQYGDPKTTNNFIGLFENIQLSLLENDIDNIDLVVISGDVAMSGKEEEYEKAKQIRSLFKKLWPNEDSQYSDRVILAPGNHDFDINFCLLNYFSAKNISKKREIDLLNLIKELLDNKPIPSFPYNKYGTIAFKRFCYDITHNDVYINNENMNFIIDDFLDWGIRFIVLNSVSNININETNRVEFFKEEISEIVQKANECPYGNEIFNIVVSHHTELFLEEVNAENNPIQVFNQLKNSLKCKLFLGGHRHINDNKDGKTSNNEKYTVIEAGTLRIDEKADEHQRGFNVLKLINVDGCINQVVELQFVFNKYDGAIKLEKTKKHEFKSH